MNPNGLSSVAYAALLALSVLVAGCGHAKVAHPLTAELSGNDSQSQMNFWHTLASRPLTSNDEAFHGLLLYMDSRDPAGTYEQRVALLKNRRMLPPDFHAPPDRAVERGTLAVAICRILKIKGGVMLHVLPQTPRYAVRELEFQEIFPPSGSYQTFSGAEFLGIIGRIEDRQRGTTIPMPAQVLPTPASTRPTTRPVR